jgi:hypothetical protein
MPRALFWDEIMQSITPTTQLLFYLDVSTRFFVTCNADIEQVALAPFQSILEQNGTTHPSTHCPFKAKVTYGYFH